MSIYVICSNYFDSGMFGTYSTVKRARLALEDFLTNDEDIVTFEDIGGYAYQFTTIRGETFSAEIFFDTLDAEFESGNIKED